MRVRMGLLQRRPDLSPEDFGRHWRAVHGPLAARLPGLLRYHQNHLRERLAFEGIPPADWPLDGISELWFDPAADMRALAATPPYRAVAEDEPRCMLPSRVIVADQHTVAAGQGGCKVIALLTRAEAATPEDFAAAWLRAAPDAAGCTLNLVRDRLRAGTPIGRDAAPVDAVLELWFATDAPAAIHVSPASRAATAGATAWRTEIHVVV